jgi:4-hydroxy-2-oxovalerate aldolase
MIPTPAAHILDCTIRDGSYVVGYQFTVEDTAIVAQGLAALGIGHIEVGHGLGLNAQNCGQGGAAITDVEYITAARSAVSAGARVGSFLIPGIGTEESLREAVDAGLDFVRLGIDVDDFVKLEPFARLAKALGIEVWGNMMKSYLVTPDEFAETARRVGEFGVDVVAIVDSAGGMRPDDVAAYTEAAVVSTKVPLAFHGHNNLTLAVANCLRFVECGGVYVDGSLSGLGRSGGNAATELLAALLSQRGRLAHKVDWERLIAFADAVMEFSVPFHARRRAAEIATGLNYFHSSFGAIVEDASADAGVPLFKTILQLPRSSRKIVSASVAGESARRVLAHGVGKTVSVSCGVGLDWMERTQANSLESLAERLRVQKGKSPQQRVITVACVAGLKEPRIGPLRSTGSAVVAHIEVGGGESLREACKLLDDSADLWLIDVRLDREVLSGFRQPVYFYEDDSVVRQALVDTLQAIGTRSIVVVGDDNGELAAVKKRFAASGAEIPVADALVTCDPAAPAREADLDRIRSGGAVVLIRGCALSESAFALARKRGLKLWRLDCGPALVAEAERVLSTHNRFRLAAGETEVAPGVRVLAGGVVGEAGDVVVDHLNSPRFILGEADGRGGIRAVSPAEKGRAVQRWILEHWEF